MLRRPVALDDHQLALWSAFIAAYSATRTRPAVDRFLACLFGKPDAT